MLFFSMPPFLSADTADIYYEDHGDSKSYPLILIHPIGGNILIWHQEIPLLVKEGFRVIAYEIRGHHRTAMGPAKAYAMRELVNDLTLLLEHLNIKKCTMIGHSIGGIIASMYAAEHPEIIDAIGPDKDVPAPDVNTNDQVMAWVMDTYSMHVGHTETAVVTGKPVAPDEELESPSPKRQNS
mgnify:CR=1 FL=1